MGCGLFLEAVTEVSGDFPDIKLNDEYIDNAANGLVCHPQEYDMILTTNLFGDIISDEAAALVSNLVPTANIGDDSAVFLPVNHQHRPKEAGLGIVNPIPTITCVVAMLEYIGENEAALRVKDSIAEALKKNALQSRSTVEVNDAICKGI
jgi:isocitrate/isopropylmalate dehydrogenase